MTNRLRRLDLDCDRGRCLIERTSGCVRWPYHFFLASDDAAALPMVPDIYNKDLVKTKHTKYMED